MELFFKKVSALASKCGMYIYIRVLPPPKGECKFVGQCRGRAHSGGADIVLVARPSEDMRYTLVHELGHALTDVGISRLLDEKTAEVLRAKLFYGAAWKKHVRDMGAWGAEYFGQHPNSTTIDHPVTWALAERYADALVRRHRVFWDKFSELVLEDMCR